MNILPALVRSEDPRIVCTTSCMQHFGKFDFTNANSTADPASYSHSKLYFQTWLTELQSRLSANPSLRHISVQGIHPGFVSTGIWTPVQAPEGTQPMAFADKLANVVVGYFGVNPQQGSLAILQAATAKECAVEMKGGQGGGRYFNRIWPAEPMPQTTSPVCRKEIWDFVDEELRLSEKGLLDIFKD